MKQMTRMINDSFVCLFSGLASLALVNTNAAAAAGLLTWVVLDLFRGRVSVSGACSGIIIGLVGITPACGFVQPGWSILFGVIPVVFVYSILLFKHHLRYDDTLDVAVIHAGGNQNRIDFDFELISFQVEFVVHS